MRVRRLLTTGCAIVMGAATVLAALPATTAGAEDGSGGEGGRASTFAVYGDSPYGADGKQLAATPDFIKTINDDPQVGGVVHVGDIHSGSEPCTQAYDQSIANLWTGFVDPLYYTPGDNEWADCQKAKQQPLLAYQKGDPIANLALVRQLFFPRAGVTLGQNKKFVLSQAFAYDRRFPTDKQYVENTIWAQSGVVFVTVNIPGGSNNDHDVWNPVTTGSATETPAQHDEYTFRTDADLRWLDTAFGIAKLARAKGVVVLEQADMWDTEKSNPAILTNYTPFVAKIADRTRDFGGSVLLINGDTHVYRSDSPLVDGAPCASELPARCAIDAHDLQSLPGFTGLGTAKFHRIVVHGSNDPLLPAMEWLKLKIDPSQNAPEGDNAVGPFSWERKITALPAP
ncbi:MAG: hypothetical protein QOF40_3137 [Actinomycetota bacterium]|nr:hypothetical protein [Actinomycetota bacterium]